jgi:hypothetical protein
MNARTQITMDPEMRRRAHAKAAELGISFAEYVRRVIAEDRGEDKPKADISFIFDLVTEGEPTDIAREQGQAHRGCSLAGVSPKDRSQAEASAQNERVCR